MRSTLPPLAALERLPVDGAADLDQAAGAEELHGFRPDQVGPAALGLALPQGRGEFLVHQVPRSSGLSLSAAWPEVKTAILAGTYRS